MTKDEQSILNNLYDAVYYLSRAITGLDYDPIYMDHAMHRIALAGMKIKEMQDNA